jgi:hypothetical protein
MTEEKKPVLAGLVRAGDAQTEAIAITYFVWQVNDVSNLYLVNTSDGDVMVNTGFMDNAERNAAVCRKADAYYELPQPRPVTPAEIAANQAAIDESYARASADSAAIVNRFGKADDFALMAVDDWLPIITTKPLSFALYQEFAMPTPMKGQSQLVKDSWGLVPLGSALHFLIFDAGLEYRILNGAFQPGHFDGSYEMQRVSYQGDTYRTKEELYWNEDLGNRQGIFGRLTADLGGFIELGGTYSHMFLAEEQVKGISDPWLQDHLMRIDDRAYSFKAGLGQTVVNFVPKLARAEAFYRKAKVGQDVWMVNGDHQWDSFLERSRYASWGYTLGFEVAGGMQVLVSNVTTYTRVVSDPATGATKLEPTANFGVETVLVF